MEIGVWSEIRPLDSLGYRPVWLAREGSTIWIARDRNGQPDVRGLVLVMEASQVATLNGLLARQEADEERGS